MQSDLAQDVRRRGPKGGSKERDQAEMDMLEAQRSKLKAMAPATNEATQKNRDIELVKIDNRMDIVQGRILDKTTDYSLQQPFAGFEARPAVEQQLLMKNAIQAAARAGKDFITFPGAESAQAQLYEKVPNNLKQVLKDLGGKEAGFEIKPIELPPTTHETELVGSKNTHPKGTPVTAWGIIWSPEAAKRIMQSGVPFAKGGSVDKSNTDYRAYI
jgi:hypothetical protein